MSKALQIKEAIANAEQNIAFLAGLPDKKLQEKLETIHLQSEIAIKSKNTETLQLLEIWRSQIIEARIFKAENKIPDTTEEFEQAITDIHVIQHLQQKQQKAIQQIYSNELPKTTEQEQLPENKNQQLTLF